MFRSRHGELPGERAAPKVHYTGAGADRTRCVQNTRPADIRDIYDGITTFDLQNGRASRELEHHCGAKGTLNTSAAISTQPSVSTSQGIVLATDSDLLYHEARWPLLSALVADAATGWRT